MLDDLRKLAKELETNAREAVFEHAYAIGNADGRYKQVVEIIQKLEAEAENDEEPEAE